MRSPEIRRTFLEFFRARDHRIWPSSSLIPNDPTLLLTLIGTVRELTHAVERVTDETVPLLANVGQTVAGVNTELERVDVIVANVQKVSDHTEKLTGVLREAVANPVIKVLAFAAGTRTALRAARSSS